MASFFRGVRNSALGRSRDTVIKEALTNNLSECVKAIQFNHQTEEYHHQTIGSTDLSNALCHALEAIFLHGLKDTLFRKAKNAFSSDIDQKPDLSFWPLVMVLSHKDNINHISSLQQITTETGQCRAWIRMALNDCLLSSYISTILKNMSSAKSFYSHHAFVRDAELLDVAQRYLEGVESCTQFDLPINSSLLNSWPDDVLMLAGVWMPTMRNCPIAAGVDVASTLNDIEPETKKPSRPDWTASHQGLGRMLSMDPDEAFNFIMASTSDSIIGVSSTSNMNTSVSSDDPKIEEKPVEVTKDPVEDVQEDCEDESDQDFDKPSSAFPDVVVTGNSLIGKTGWTSDNNEDIRISRSNSSTDSVTSKTPEIKSLTSSLDISSSPGNSYVKTPHLREIMRGLHRELKLSCDGPESSAPGTSSNSQLPVDDPVLSGLGFEVVSRSPSKHFDAEELKKLTTQLCSLSREYGLDSQDYLCKNCRDTVGTRVSKAKVCAFTGQYFCSDCMDPNVFMIPARVIHNWDFRRYPVSKKAALFMLESQHEPLIDVVKINPLIYQGVDHMAQLQNLRVQLNFLRAYLFTCREPVIEDLQKRVWPREYLYEQVHTYSISDLAQISNGSLASQLQKVVTFAQNHVKDCWLCSQKGFICEVCNNPKVLYPFHTDSTYRCEVCFSVFHSGCLNARKPCPKCHRRKKRQDLSLVDAVHGNFYKTLQY